MNGEYKKGRAWIELDRAALQYNVQRLRALLPQSCALMPAVKANAYGHGAVPVARELNRLGVRAFCVATAQEGAELRENGVEGEILVLGYTHPALFPLLQDWGLSQTVADLDHAGELARFGQGLCVHIGIDTGMHRLGLDWQDTESLARICRGKELRVKGIFTHLCTEDSCRKEDIEFAQKQGERFFSAVEALRRMGCAIPKAHILSSCGLLNCPELGGDYARTGIALYGLTSRPEDMWRGDAALRPVLSLKARVASVRRLSPGEGAGYGLEFCPERETRLAALSIGYADGLPRDLSCGAGRVLIRGREAPVAGRICMDQTLVDVTDIPGVQAGDEAVLIGRSGRKSISAYELAAQTGTITNEIVSRLGPRLERILI